MTANTLLLVADTQYDLVMHDGRRPVPNAEHIIVPGIHFLARLDPARYAAVLFTFATHDAQTYGESPMALGDDSLGIPPFPLHCEIGTAGWENVFNPDLVPDGIDAHMLLKNRFSMWEQDGREQRAVTLTKQRELDDNGRFFFAPDRADFIERMKDSGVTTIDIMGVPSDYGVRSAIEGFLERGFAVRVIAHLTAGIDEDAVQMVMRSFYGRVEIV